MKHEFMRVGYNVQCYTCGALFPAVDGTYIPIRWALEECPGPPKPKPEVPEELDDTQGTTWHREKINGIIRYLKALEIKKCG